MKKNLAIVILFLIISNIFADEGYKLKKIGLSSGQGFITSGLNVNISMQNAERSLSFTANSMRFYGNLQLAGPLSITAGAFDNAPWAGAMLSHKWHNLNFVNWIGYGGGDYKKPGFTPFFFFSDHWVTYTTGKFEMLYMLQHIRMDLPQHVVGLKYKEPLSRNIGLFVSAQYDMLNGKYPLFQAGLSWAQ
jgi:hypothetical protein